MFEIIHHKLFSGHETPQKEFFVQYKRGSRIEELLEQLVNRHSAPTLDDEIGYLIKTLQHANNDKATFDGIEKFRAT